METLRLTIKDLTVRYGKTTVVDSLSLEVGNETVVLFGPSGCGKTTVLKAILGVSEVAMRVQGEVLLNGRPIKGEEGAVGMVFQGPVVPHWMTVRDLCRIGHNMCRMPKQEQHDKIMKMLTRFEIAQLAERYPYQLSGGQKQRVALAVTLLNDPRVLLLDEPSTFIDGMTRLSIWNFIEREIRPLGIPTLLVSHDPHEAVWLGDKIYRLGNPATVLDCLDVELPHPRTDDVSRSEPFWRARSRLVGSV